jgi:RNA polymerase sigma-70 factor (ECF subfamily)
MMKNEVETPDDELAAACARRDESPHARRLAEDAFLTLYDRHARWLIAFLAGRVGRAAVEDVHQEVWAKVWRAVPTRFRGGDFRAWLYQIARNLVIDQRRKRTPEPLPDESRLIDRRQLDAARPVGSDRWAALARCLQKLERVNARVADLVRSRASGESYDAYCERTGMPADKAYRAFHQAKARLQACVEGTSP